MGRNFSEGTKHSHLYLFQTYGRYPYVACFDDGSFFVGRSLVAARVAVSQSDGGQTAISGLRWDKILVGGTSRYNR